LYYEEKTISPLKDRRGKITHFVSTGKDITQRKRAEEELLRNYQIQSVLNGLLNISLQNISLEEQLDLIIERIVSIPWLTFESKGGIFVVEGDPEVLVMKAQRGLATPLQNTCAQVPFGRCLCGRAALTREIQFADCVDDRHENRYEGLTPHGHYCVPIQSGDKILGVIVLYLREGHRRNRAEEEFLHAIANVLAGIIQRKQAEKELKRREEAFQSLYESAITWRGSLNDFCDHVVINLSRLLKVSHVTVERLEGERIRVISMMADGQLLHEGEMCPAGSPWPGGPCERVRQEKAVCQYQGPLKELFPQDEFFQEHPLQAYLGVPIKNGVGDVIGVIHAMDWQERTFAEDEIHLLEIFARYIAHEIERSTIEAQLRHTQKMEAIGRLAGGVAHDFNNLLTPITGYSQLLLSRLEDHNPLRKDIEEIKKAAERAASLTRQLLAFSRKQVLQPEVLDLNAVVADMEKLLRRLIGEDIELVTALEPGLESVKADPGQIEQVIMNLAVNARDAMPEGGRLIIKTENVTLDEEHCKVIPEARPGKFVCLSVTDTGVGMDKETLQHIFEPFFTTKEGGKGTGLGLSVVYGIVKQHEGWIDVSSVPGRGATFKVYLPVFYGEREAEQQEAISWRELQGSGKRILLVEDEAGVRKFATGVLGENGYEVFEAASAKEAMDIFEREKGRFHLVFSDVVLPDKNGLQLVDQLLSRKPGLRILLSSGYTEEKSQWSVIRERGFRFLQKPYALPDLLQAVKEAIETS